MCTYVCVGASVLIVWINVVAKPKIIFIPFFGIDVVDFKGLQLRICMHKEPVSAGRRDSDVLLFSVCLHIVDR